MSVLAKIRKLPLLRSLCVKKAKIANSLAWEPDEVLVDIFAYLDYVTFHALAWAGHPCAYSICVAGRHSFLPRPREMTLTLRGGSRKSMSLSSDGSEEASIKIRRAWKVQLNSNVARSVATATQKVLKTRGQRPVPHLELLDVSEGGVCGARGDLSYASNR